MRRNKKEKEKEFICKDCANCLKIEKSGTHKYYTHCLNADGLTYDAFYDNIIYCKRFQEKK